LLTRWSRPASSTTPDYHENLWRRLLRTLQALYLIVYGSKQEAKRAGEAAQAVHAHVHRTTRQHLGPFPAGTRHDASDPEAKRLMALESLISVAAVLVIAARAVNVIGS
jgi:uncharacterized protein (DUF2236 family)